MDELVYKTDTDVQMLKAKTDSDQRGNMAGGNPGAWDEHKHTTIYKITSDDLL